MKRPAEQRADEGFTLTEMLVTILLFSILTTVIMNVLITSMRAQTRSVERTDTLNAAKRALERTAADLREANPLLVAKAREIKSVSTLNGVSTTTTYSISTDGTRLLVTKSVGSAIGTPKTLLRGLSLGATGAAFTYSGAGGAPLQPLTVGGSEYDTSEVQLVSLSLPVRLPSANSTIRVDQQVDLRNQES